MYKLLLVRRFLLKNSFITLGIILLLIYYTADNTPGDGTFKDQAVKFLSDSRISASECDSLIVLLKEENLQTQCLDRTFLEGYTNKCANTLHSNELPTERYLVENFSLDDVKHSFHKRSSITETIFALEWRLSGNDQNVELQYLFTNITIIYLDNSYVLESMVIIPIIIGNSGTIKTLVDAFALGFSSGDYCIKQGSVNNINVRNQNLFRLVLTLIP